MSEVPCTVGKYHPFRGPRFVPDSGERQHKSKEPKESVWSRFEGWWCAPTSRILPVLLKNFRRRREARLADPQASRQGLTPPPSGCPTHLNLTFWVCFFCVFFTRVTGPRRSLSLKLSDTRVCEPLIRARLGTTAHFCKVVQTLRLWRGEKPGPTKLVSPNTGVPRA